VSNPLDFVLAHPVVAILRGLEPAQAPAIGDALFDAGIRVMEVPLNSPDAFRSIHLLRTRFNGRALVGAGTVLTAGQVHQVADAGGALTVSPNFDPEVVGTTRARGLLSLPGVCTPTEAFQALRAGADILKLFPGEVMGPHGASAMRSVLPGTARLFAVGGVSAQNVPAWRAAGVDGIGVGSAIFRPSFGTDEVYRAACQILLAWQGS